MPVPGRKPKPDGQAVNRHKPTHDWTEVPDVPFKGGPKLPARRSSGKPWTARLKQKWAAWSSMPHCVLWAATEWEFALDSIEIAALVLDGETRWATELRNRERVMGTTFDFRRDLRVRYVDPQATPAEQPPGVVALDDYRNL